jgi:putative Ig domain-containing protein
MNVCLPLRLNVLAAFPVLAALLCPAQQDAGEPLVIRTTSLPKAYVKQPFEARLQAQGRSAPFKWEVTDGHLPAGIALRRDGILSGVPSEAGEFPFTVTVTDSGSTAYERKQQLSLLVVSPLMAQWGRYPKVNGRRIEGSVLVSNQTDRSFDLTVIVLAVNEAGRATAIGYQHIPLKKNSDPIEIPFGDTVARGSYQVNVDAVAEVAATNSVYRARLVPKERFLLKQGP